jgi:hypothetical protein
MMLSADQKALAERKRKVVMGFIARQQADVQRDIERSRAMMLGFQKFRYGAASQEKAAPAAPPASARAAILAAEQRRQTFAAGRRKK